MTVGVDPSLAFRVTEALAMAGEAPSVAAVTRALRAEGVAIVAPATDQPWGHRTVFFRDPDGNLLEIYADI